MNYFKTHFITLIFFLATLNSNAQGLEEGRNHFFVSASSGPEVYIFSDGIAGKWFPVHQAINVNAGYHFHNQFLLGCTVGALALCSAGPSNGYNSNITGEGIQRGSEDPKNHLLLKIDYNKSFGSNHLPLDSFNIKDVTNTYGGVPDQLTSEVWALEGGYLFYGDERRRNFIDFTFGYQWGMHEISFMPNANNFRSLEYAVSGIKIDINFSFAVSNHVHILWDLFGMSYLGTSTSAIYNFTDGTPSTPFLFVNEDDDAVGNIYMRLGLRYNFL